MKWSRARTLSSTAWLILCGSVVLLLHLDCLHRGRHNSNMKLIHELSNLCQEIIIVCVGHTVELYALALDYFIALPTTCVLLFLVRDSIGIALWMNGVCPAKRLNLIIVPIWHVFSYNFLLLFQLPLWFSRMFLQDWTLFIRTTCQNNWVCYYI